MEKWRGIGEQNHVFGKVQVNNILSEIVHKNYCKVLKLRCYLKQRALFHCVNRDSQVCPFKLSP